MSRIRVFGLDGKSKGELSGRLSRGWSLVGPADVRGGGQSTLDLSQANAAKAWLELGRMVLVEDAALPPWCGLIDPDWNAYGKPSLTVYNIEYMLSLRTFEDVQTVTKPTAGLVQDLLLAANEQEDTMMRPGQMDQDAPHEATLERRPIWEQMREIVENAGMELTFRPQLAGGRLVVYVDLDKRAGRNTKFLYHDGFNANMTVTGAAVVGEIWNRVIGINDAGSEDERLLSGVIEDETSQKAWRTRSQVVQFDGVTDKETLVQETRDWLEAHSRPRLQLTVQILRQGGSFQSARLGNTAMFHAADVRLPGGQHGVRGTGRMLALAYDETRDLLGATVVITL